LIFLRLAARRDATRPPSISFLHDAFITFFLRLPLSMMFSSLCLKGCAGEKSADKTSFLHFKPTNCLRNVQTIQVLEKLFDL